MPPDEKKVKKKESQDKEDRAREDLNEEIRGGLVKFEVYGEEMVEKVVKLSGNSGRVYLPPDWVGCRVKMIRIGPRSESQ